VRYFVADGTLVVEGDFEALSSGVDGGRRRVSRIINKQVPKDFDCVRPEAYLDDYVRSQGWDAALYFGLLTAVEMKNLAVVRLEPLTTFITAGLSNPGRFGTINIILVSDEGLSEGAMVNAVITITEAKASILRDLGFGFYGTTTDAVVVAYERGRSGYVKFSGSATDFGSKTVKAVRAGIEQSLKAAGEV